MSKFIVEGSSQVLLPLYLRDGTKKISLKMKDGISSSREFHPSKLEDWPSPDDLGLDSNQFKAFQAALTSEFVIIQGPPGTGKTFLGLRIAQVLLENSKLWKEPSLPGSGDGPILIVCYTNHALDQFLLGILGSHARQFEPSSLIRVGGRSKFEQLQTEYSLRSAISRMKKTDRVSSAKYRRGEFLARKAIESLKESRQKLVNELHALQNDLGKKQ